MCNDVFLSYDEKLKNSIKIADELDRFFKSWEVTCHVIRKAEIKGDISSYINETISKSNWFIHIFTDNPNMSPWMKKELDMFKYIHHNKLKEETAMWAAIFTPQYKMNEIYNNDSVIQHEIIAGKRDCISISNRQKLKNLLCSILVDKEKLLKKHGEVKIPDFGIKIESIPDERDKINFEKLKEFINNFHDSYEGGLECIYRDKNVAMKRILLHFEKLKQDDCVKMLGFTLRRYVHNKDRDGNDNYPGQLFTEALNSQGCKAKLLLLHEECFAMHERSKIESPEEYDENDLSGTILYSDRNDVIKYCVDNKWYSKNRNGDQNIVSIKKYCTPYIGIVLFNEKAFVELYHLGKDPEAISESKKTICGEVPVLVFKKGTTFYKIFESHFDNIWENADWVEISS